MGNIPYIVINITDVFCRLSGLNFTLRCFHDMQQDETSGEIVEVEKMNYTPLELEKETDVFVNALGVLAEEFTFGRHQMDAFLVNLREALEAAISEDASR